MTIYWRGGGLGDGQGIPVMWFIFMINKFLGKTEKAFHEIAAWIVWLTGGRFNQPLNDITHELLFSTSQLHSELSVERFFKEWDFWPSERRNRIHLRRSAVRGVLPWKTFRACARSSNAYRAHGRLIVTRFITLFLFLRKKLVIFKCCSQAFTELRGSALKSEKGIKHLFL